MIDESCVTGGTDESDEAGEANEEGTAEETPKKGTAEESVKAKNSNEENAAQENAPTAEPEDDWRRTWHAVRDLLGSKWAFHVVRALAESERGFNDLKRDLDGVTAKTLSERLQELRCLGFVEKEVHATSPPTTTYRLTGHGEELAGVLADVESLVEVVECRDGDCAVPLSTTPECASDCACEG